MLTTSLMEMLPEGFMKDIMAVPAINPGEPMTSYGPYVWLRRSFSSPVILAHYVNTGTIQAMTGFMRRQMDGRQGIVPVAIHLDHGTA